MMILDTTSIAMETYKVPSGRRLISNPIGIDRLMLPNYRAITHHTFAGGRLGRQFLLPFHILKTLFEELGNLFQSLGGYFLGYLFHRHTGQLQGDCS
jgi:hypothetical protein